MKLVKAIKDLYARIRAAAIIPGEGVTVAHTPTGTIVSVVRTVASQVAQAVEEANKGMFHIVRMTRDEGNDYVSVRDTSDAADRTDLNDSDSPPKYAGIAHVNGVASGYLPRRDFTFNGTGLFYIYLHWNAGGVLAQESEKAGVLPQEGGDALPVFEIVCSRNTFSSGFLEIYYLIGRVKVVKEKQDGEDRLAVDGISQDHRPAPIYMEWYGPDIGVAEEGYEPPEEDGDGQ